MNIMSNLPSFYPQTPVLDQERVSGLLFNGDQLSTDPLLENSSSNMLWFDFILWESWSRPIASKIDATVLFWFFISPFFTAALEAKETWRGAVCSIRTTLSLSAVPSFHNCPQIWKISTINWTPAHWLANKQGVNHPDKDLTTTRVVFLWTHIFPAKLDQTEKAFRLF